MPKDIYISYHPNDEATAEMVCAALEASGMRCWIAPRDVPRGADPAQAVVEGIRECALTVLIFSAYANDSVTATREVQRSFEGGGWVIPFRVDDVVPTGAMEYYLSSVQWLDSVGGVRQDSLDQLLQATRYLLEHRRRPAAAPAVAAAARPLQEAVAGSPSHYATAHTSTASAAAPRPNNLPSTLTSFIGRQLELNRVLELLQDGRLVTLSGPGGTGKTRLAMEAANRLLPEFPGGVWLAELAPVSDGVRVPQTVGAALGLREEPGVSWEDLVARHIGEVKTLLVLDNCEHLVDDCARFVSRLLRSSPALQILATSQHLLHVPGEKRLLVPPLPHPPMDRTYSLEELKEYESVRLFVERARTVAPEFELDEQNAPAVARICGRLDGIPLAIEFAAARVRAMRVEYISDRLNDRFRLLTSNNHLLPSRQQTLRAAVEWSHALLSEQERTLLRRLAVFAGGCTLEAAEAVCSGGDIEDWEVLDILTWLVDKSLIRFEDAEDQMGRYRLLETIRHYSAERLREIGEWEECCQRHSEFYLAYAERVGSLGADHQAMAIRQMAKEEENLHAAIDWCRDANAVDAEARFVDALYWFWLARGAISELKQHVHSVLEREDQLKENHQRIRIRLNALKLSEYLCDYEAARRYGEAALIALREVGDQEEIGGLLFNLGMVQRASGDNEGALARFEEARDIFEVLGDQTKYCYALQWIGNIALYKRDFPTARTVLEQGLVGIREGGGVWRVAWLLLPLATVCHRLGDLPASVAYMKEALDLFTHLEDRFGTVFALERCAGVATARDRADIAARLYGIAERERNTMNTPISHGDRLEFFDEEFTRARSALGEDAFADGMREGRDLPLERGVALARDHALA